MTLTLPKGQKIIDIDKFLQSHRRFVKTYANATGKHSFVLRSYQERLEMVEGMLKKQEKVLSNTKFFNVNVMQ